MAFQEDTSLFLDDFGVQVLVPARSIDSLALVDASDADAFGDRAQSNDFRLTGPTSVFGILKVKDDVTVPEGEHAGEYRVREVPEKIDDGAFVQVLLTKKTS